MNKFRSSSERHGALALSCEAELVAKSIPNSGGPHSAGQQRLPSCLSRGGRRRTLDEHGHETIRQIRKDEQRYTVAVDGADPAEQDVVGAKSHREVGDHLDTR
eukprot:6178053-Pleurochrysis_carterae.AAC.1